MRMRVLHIIDHLGLGGAQMIAKGIMEGFESENSFLYALRRRDNQLSISHGNVYIAKTSSKYSIKSFFELVSFIRRNNIEILHCHLGKSIVYGIVLKKLFFKKIKLVVHEHGRIFEDEFFYNLFLRMLKGSIERFIVISEATSKKLATGCGVDDSKMRLLYNFVDLENFHVEKETGKVKSKAERNEFLVGFAGRLITRKGWEEFVRAASLISNQDSRIRFLIVGDGSDTNKMLELISQLNISDRIDYMGFVSDMQSFYKDIGCLVVPSHWEPLGLVAIEAQACGVPVIASNTEALNEIINHEENGLLFEVRNENDLAAKIETIYKDRDLRQRLIANGLRSVEKYSLKHYVKLLHTIYEEL